MLLAVILLFVSCGGEDDSTKRGGASSQAPTPAPDGSATPDEEPSFSEADPNGGPALPDPEDLESQQPQPQPVTGGDASAPANTTGNNANVTVPADGSCADAELAVTPVPATTSAQRGTPVVLKLKIKNVSARSCTRDLGAGAQELYIDQGARKYWSSDTCSADRSANQQRMQPGGEYEFAVTWNGRQSSKCTAGAPAGPAPPPGRYELRGRVGTRVSEPVALTITG